MKAAYLYNFAKFVQWPGDPAGDMFDMCVAGTDPFMGALDAIVEGEKINGRLVHRRSVTTAADAVDCRILFVSSALALDAAEFLRSLGGQPILTVSDTTRFVARGGMIQFFMERGRVRFAINLAAAQEARLVVSSELLRVSSRVDAAP